MVGTNALRLLAAGVAAAGLVAVSAGAAAAADPPGDNGTVKIDGIVFDVHPDNQPHVGCTFQVDFYGFDEGDLTATVLFEAIPATTTAVPPGQGQELLTDEVAIGEDAAGGGTDLDAEATYDLTDALAGIEPHAQQGWHVQLTVHAEGSIGADTKHKVFWVQGCVPPGSSTTTSSTTTSSTSSTTSTVPGSSTTSSSTTSSTTPGESSTTSTSAPSGVSPSGPTTSPPSGSLPFTGSNSSLPLAATGLGLVALGIALVVVRRLRLGAES